MRVGEPQTISPAQLLRRKRLFCISLLCVTMLVSVSAVAESTPTLTDLAVFPSAIKLCSSRDYQGIVVQASYSNETTRDVTLDAKISLEDPGFVRLDGARVLPVADGETVMHVSFGDQALSVPLTVVDAATDRPISFKLDVMPILMRAGCNSGACHGSARGQDGFRLSLFGYDPDGDYFRLTREQSGRRINLAVPEESLLMLKSTGKVPHTGGQLFDSDSEYYATIMRWLKGITPKDDDGVATPVAAEILPGRMVMAGTNATQQMVVIARYSDGQDRDVTSTAVFMTSDSTVADISEDGRILARGRGEAFVMARFATFTVGAQVIVVPENEPFTFPDLPETHYIDKLVNDKLRKLRVAPSDLCSDEEFLRRAHLDIVGLLPSRADYDAFTSSQVETKREQLIDQLLARKEFVELWVMKWAELLQIRSSKDFSYKSALLYYNWLQERIANDVPMNTIVRDLLSASGGTFKSPPTNYYQLEDDTLKTAENAAQVFMGLRLQCAQCHNHPFDQWTMDDYYSYAAFFAQVGRKKAEDPRETIVFNKGSGTMQNPLTKQDMTPKFLGGDTPELEGSDRRRALAEWLTQPDNPYFSKNLANIVWAHFFGRGIVEPVDDVRVSNPPSNPDLLDALATRFIEYNYDFKKLVRDICTSRTYQLATRPNKSNRLDSSNFSHARVRRIRAEVLLDCISQVTNTKMKFKGLPLGARAVQIADGQVSTYFLDAFGRASRETVCSCEVVAEPNLSQALHLLNGDTTNKKIKNGKVVPALLETRDVEDALRELYIQCLSREPTPKEVEALLPGIAAAENKMAGLEDVFWALLNSKEFIFNH